MAGSNADGTGPKLYNVDNFRKAFLDAKTSAERPADATLIALKDEILDFLSAGFTIGDAVAVLQNNGMAGTERQIRYGLNKIGVNGSAATAAHRAGRGGAGRSAGRKGARPRTQKVQPEDDALRRSGEAAPASPPVPDSPLEQAGSNAGQAGDNGRQSPAAPVADADGRTINDAPDDGTIQIGRRRI